jgi:hypothetical protein
VTCLTLDGAGPCFGRKASASESLVRSFVRASAFDFTLQRFFDSVSAKRDVSWGAEMPRRKNTIWHMEIVTAKEAQAPIEAKLASFTKHKTSLLDYLRNTYERGPQSETFEEETWGRLIKIAEGYFWEISMREGSMPVAERVKRLRQLAKVAGRARDLVERAMRDDVGSDLFRGRCAEAQISAASLAQKRDWSVLGSIADEIENAVLVLTTVESAARRAAVDLRSGRGRPKGSAVLTRHSVYALARVFRQSTRRKPGAGDGPFARFVYAFLMAVGRRVLEYESVVDVIKDARSMKKDASVFQWPAGEENCLQWLLFIPPTL